jgi:hypothetical protein
VSVQRELWGTSSIEIAYNYQLGDRLPMTLRLDYLPEQYWNGSNVRDTTQQSFLNANVPNPFLLSRFASLQTSNPTLYSRMAGSSFFTAQNVQLNRLLRGPFPQYSQVNLSNLPLGPYRFEVSLSGFRTYVQTGIVLQVGASPVLNASLSVGQLEESVTVEGAAPLVDVQSAGIREVVRNEEILALPLNGRNAAELVVVSGAAVQTTTAPNRAVPGGLGISVGGGLPYGVAYLLDGAMHNNPQDNLNLPFPFPDALQEFSVATSGLNAQNGMHSGAAVSAWPILTASHSLCLSMAKSRRERATSS